MTNSLFTLLKKSQFTALFIIQSFGAFNDNVFKNALVILITYTISVEMGFDPSLIVTISAGLFILPFFLFSAIAGKIADSYDKKTLIQWIKFVEIILMVMAAIGLYYQSLQLLLIVLFLLGLQSTFFGPIKYSVLPTLLTDDELVGGNGIISAGTFLSILIGTIIGGLFILGPNGSLIISSITVSASLIGWGTSLKINSLPPIKKTKISFNFIGDSILILKKSMKQKWTKLSILGISWFWFIGATFMAQFPTFGKYIIGGSETVVILFLTTFSIGIALGSVTCNSLLKGRISALYVPFGALGMSLFMVDLWWVSQNITAASPLIEVSEFLKIGTHIRVIVDLTLIAFFGGLYIVPLYALLQKEAPNDQKSQFIAANNIINALFMVISAILTVILLSLRFSVIDIFLTVAAINIIAALKLCELLPEKPLKLLLSGLLRTVYRVRIIGMENYHNAGDRVVIIVNHTSLLDVLLLVTFLPKGLTFAVNSFIIKKWWMIPVLWTRSFFNVTTFAMESNNPMATKSLIKFMNHNRKCVIFPEGRITVTGSLMKIHEGPGLIADKSNSTLLPIRIEGAQYTPFSYLQGKVTLKLFPKITLTILSPEKLKIDPKITGRSRRKEAGKKLHTVMTNMMFNSSNYKQPLFISLVNAMKIHGANKKIIEDNKMNPITYKALILKSILLGNHLKKESPIGSHMGCLLPNSVSYVICFFALQFTGKIPTLLNTTIHKKLIISMAKTAKVTHIITSKKFLTAISLTDIKDALHRQNISIIYLEDIKICKRTKLKSLIQSKFPILSYQLSLAKHYRNPEQEAVTLFTSGTEKEAKGVALSHKNINANRFQISSVIDFNLTDRVFNALPMFHSFGLTTGTLLPLFSGLYTFQYPSPLHYQIVPEMVYNTNSTIMFGTNSFLLGYAKYAHPYDFYSIRYIFAGAEKLQENVRQLWIEKFGLRILEGYGSTETAPVISINTPMFNRIGTVGKPLPGIQCDIIPINGIKTGGTLVVKGPNIFLGYYNSNQPGKLEYCKNNTYNTGDIVEISEDHYITIKGRKKRFAKIAGEMISLSKIEITLYEKWPKFKHAILIEKDEIKGEKLILITENPTLDKDSLKNHLQASGLSEYHIPKQIKAIDKMPLLASGKINYLYLSNNE